jgi:hypothetical protein
VEHPPTDPFDDDDTLLGDADDLDHLSIEDELDDQLDADLDEDEDI